MLHPGVAAPGADGFKQRVVLHLGAELGAVA